jgi:hypothetical protein
VPPAFTFVSHFKGPFTMASAAKSKPEKVAIDALQKIWVSWMEQYQTGECGRESCSFFQKKQYIESANFPEWTRGQTAITEPLKLPEYDKNRLLRGLDEDVKCLFCEDDFLVPTKQPEFVKHLVEEHQFLIDQGWDSPNSYQNFIRISLPMSTTCLFST